MKTLYIDCSNGLNIGIITDEKVLKSKTSLNKNHSESLLMSIEELLKECKLSIKDISVIAVCIGPGSFTGIRVAISTAKGLAIGTGAKIVTFTSFDTISVTNKNYGKIVEGFGLNYYYHYRKFGRVFEGCATQDKLKVLSDGINVYTLSDNVVGSVTEFKMCKTDYNAVDVILEKIKKQDYTLLNRIAPLYLRASQAEEQRLKNGN